LNTYIIFNVLRSFYANDSQDVFLLALYEIQKIVILRNLKEEVEMQFSNINWALIAPLIAIEFILIIVALIDLSKAEKTNGPKWMWVLIIVFMNIFGPILYFIFGKKHT
jgi:Phospholipase_D-nuclease N-terminal